MKAENAGDAAFNAANDAANRAADNGPDRSGGIAADVSTMGGAIVAAGERHGIATPLNRALLALLRAISDAATSR